MKTIVFYSYKGGAGRSLLLLNYARYLALCGKKVFILDCDLEAPGLHHKLKDYGLYKDLRKWISNRTATPRYGLVDYILFYQGIDSVPKTLSHFVTRINWGKENESLFMPAGKAPDPQYARKVLDIDWKRLFPQEPPTTGIPFFQQLRKRIGDEYDPDCLLIDSRTGITDIGSVVVKFLADIFVCLSLNNPENLEGIKTILAGIRNDRGHGHSSPEKVITILTRIPVSGSEYEIRLAETAKEFLGLKNGEVFCVMHNEPGLQVAEELRFGGVRTLGQSILLRDYLNIFESLDEGLAMKSKYYCLKKYLDLADDQRSYNIKSSAASHSVLDNIRNRKDRRLRHVRYRYSQTSPYDGLVQSIEHALIHDLFEAKMLTSHEACVIDEEIINWNLLALSMQTGIIDFCSEPYYLTRLRSLTAGVIQIGTCRTFTAFVLDKGKIRNMLRGFGEGMRMEEKIAALRSYDGNISIGVLGETAAAEEVAQRVSPIVQDKQLLFFKNPRKLWDWIYQRDGGDKMILCDHAVARKIAQIATVLDQSSIADYIYAENECTNDKKELVFSYTESVPVGFMFPRADEEWRYALNSAIAAALRSQSTLWGRPEDWGDSASWAKPFTNEKIQREHGSVAKDLWNSGIRPLTCEELKEVMILGMKPDEAVDWMRRDQQE